MLRLPMHFLRRLFLCLFSLLLPNRHGCFFTCSASDSFWLNKSWGFLILYFHFLVHFKFQFVKSIYAEENHLRYETSPIETPIWNINMKQIWIINMNQYETSPKKFTSIFSFKIKVFLILKQRLQNDKKTMKQRYERFAGTSWCPH